MSPSLYYTPPFITLEILIFITHVKHLVVQKCKNNKKSKKEKSQSLCFWPLLLHSPETRKKQKNEKEKVLGSGDESRMKSEWNGLRRGESVLFGCGTRTYRLKSWVCEKKGLYYIIKKFFFFIYSSQNLQEEERVTWELTRPLK